MTVLQKLFISFFPLFLFAFSIESDINVYSNKLYLDVFDHKWKYLPSNENMNNAFDYSYIKIFFDKKKYPFGIGYFSEGNVKINKGFLETWYYAQNDFNTLLKKNDIGYYVTEPKIYGKLNYSQFQTIFFFKKFENFKITFSLLRGKVLQFMKVDGYNRQNRFVADLYYYYSNKNIVMENYQKSNDYKGLGYNIDISFFKELGLYKIKIDFFNVLGAINWHNVILMKYHFDSNIKYIGEDGYYHYKPFGVGKFVKTSFYQKLPFFIKYEIQKKFKKFIIGDEGMYCSDTRYDTFFIKKNFLKLGYVPQVKNFVLGVVVNHFAFEVSNNIKYHSKFLKMSFEINY